MYLRLLSIEQVAPIPALTMHSPFLYWYKPDLKKVLQLIKAGWITFNDAPNMNSNPLPNHASGNRTLML
jgi:hypothetical protein